MAAAVVVEVDGQLHLLAPATALLVLLAAYMGVACIGAHLEGHATAIFPQQGDVGRIVDQLPVVAGDTRRSGGLVVGRLAGADARHHMSVLERPVDAGGGGAHLHRVAERGACAQVAHRGRVTVNFPLPVTP